MRKLIFAVIAALSVASVHAVVTDTTSRRDTTGNGVTTAFTFSFPAQKTTDIEVYVNGVKLLSGYTVALTASPGVGGTVTFTTAPAASASVRIQRAVPKRQETVYTPYSAFPAKTTEKALDRIVMQAQEVKRDLDDLTNIVGTGNPDANLAEVTAPGSTTARKLADRAADVVNVKDFGAKGDGTTDDTAAIQAAINALPLNPAAPVRSPSTYANGGTVLLPRGRYKVTAPLVSRRGLRVRGEGSESSQVVSFSATGVFKHQLAEGGGYMPDEVAFEDLSIWQDATVPATSGAGIDIVPPTTNYRAVRLRVRNVIVEGTYYGVRFVNGIACSVRDSLISKTVSHGVYVFDDASAATATTTSTTFENVYSYLSQTGDGFRWEGSEYVSCVSCASDSNARYGYSSELGSTVTLLASGAEQNGDSAVYLHGTQSAYLNVRAVFASGVRHAITLDAVSSVMIVGSTLSSGGATGYGIHVAASAGPIIVSSTSFNGNYAGVGRTDAVSNVLNLGEHLVGGFRGGIGNTWSFGSLLSSEPTTELRVGGVADSTVVAGLKSDATFTGAGTSNAAIRAQGVTADTAVTYPVVMGVHAQVAAKGTASTITRSVGIAAERQTAGATSNAAFAACTVTPPAGTWALASACTDETYLSGNLRLGGATGPQFYVGTAAPTTGTWVQGSHVFNSAAAVGQPKGWVCTVGGTPGTWVADSNL